MALTQIRVASYAEYFWIDPSLLCGDINPLCVICLMFFLHPPVNVKSCKSYVQFRVVRALRAAIAPNGPEQPPRLPVAQGPISGPLVPAPGMPWDAALQLSCPVVVLAEPDPDKMLAWTCQCWELCSSARCPKGPISSLSSLFLTFKTAQVMLFYHTPRHICLWSSVWVGNAGSWVPV